MHATLFHPFLIPGTEIALAFTYATLSDPLVIMGDLVVQSNETETELVFIPFMHVMFNGMDQTLWQQWVSDQMSRHGWETQAEVARASGLPPASISQWLNPKRRQQPSVKNCRVAARAFGVSILRALVAAEHITPEEAGMQPSNETTLKGAQTREIMLELQLRVVEMEKQLEGHTTAQSGKDTALFSHSTQS